MNHVILITGANGGIGGMILQYLLSRGHKNIVCQYRRSHENLFKTLMAAGLNPEKHAFKADLKNEDEVLQMANQIREIHGFVGALVNVAGSSKNSMSWKTSKSDFMSIIEDNLLSAFLCSKEFVTQMRDNKYGRIINFSSVVGSTGIAGASAYCAAKASLVGLTKSMSKELASKNITVNAIALGYFQAGLINDVPETMQEEIKKTIPMQRFGNDKDVGALVEYILSENANYLTGQVLHLNGGQY